MSTAAKRFGPQRQGAFASLRAFSRKRGTKGNSPGGDSAGCYTALKTGYASVASDARTLQKGQHVKFALCRVFVPARALACPAGLSFRLPRLQAFINTCSQDRLAPPFMHSLSEAPGRAIFTLWLFMYFMPQNILASHATNKYIFSTEPKTPTSGRRSFALPRSAALFLSPLLC